MYLGFSHTLEVRQNTTYIEKCPEFDTVILTLTKSVLHLIYNEKQNAFGFWKMRGYFIGPQNQRFRLQRSYFVPNPQNNVVFQTCLRAWYALWSGVVCVWWFLAIELLKSCIKPSIWCFHDRETLSVLLAPLCRESPSHQSIYQIMIQ